MDSYTQKTAKNQYRKFKEPAEKRVKLNDKGRTIKKRPKEI